MQVKEGGDVIMSRMNLHYTIKITMHVLLIIYSTLALFYSHILLLQCLLLDSMSKSYEVQKGAGPRKHIRNL